MPRALTLLLTLALLVATPRLALAKDFDRRYHVGQGIAWSGLIALPVGGLLLGYNEIPKSWNDHDAPLMAAFTVMASAPLVMTIGDLTAASGLAHTPGKRWSLNRTAGWVALGMIGGAAGLAGLTPGLSVGGEGLIIVPVSVYGLATIPATIQLFLNRRCYRGGGDDLEDLDQLHPEDRHGLQIALLPVLGQDRQGVALVGRFR